jgi:hypothetical protein
MMHPDREDEKNVNLAESLGFTVDRSTEKHNGLAFNKGSVRIWAIREGWQAADLISGRYQNHRPNSNLANALRLESNIVNN